MFPPVIIYFYPAFTTFQFTLKSESGSGNLTLNSVKLSTTADDSYVTGTGYYTFTGGTFVYDGTPSKDVTVTFNPKLAITEEDAATFTIFALPVSLTKMTLTVNWTKDGTIVEKSLKLNENGSPIDFAACNFVQISGLAVPDHGIRLFVSGVEVDDLDNISHTISF